LAVTRSVAHRNQWIAVACWRACLRRGVVAMLQVRCQICSREGAGAVQRGDPLRRRRDAHWHNVWMARHGSELAGELRAAGQAVVEGSKSCWRCGRGRRRVLREGVKWCCPVRRHCSQGDSGWEVALGGVAGLVPGAMIAF